MLPGGAHCQLGPYQFFLDEDVDSQQLNSGFFRPHYTKSAESLFATADTAIVGMPKKENVHPERLIWSVFDDWAGGEGNRLYYEDDPLVYDYADGLNPRIRGELTGRPARGYLGSTLSTNDVSRRPVFALAQQSLWYGGAHRIGFASISGAITSWTVVDSTSTGTTDFTALQHLTGTYAITAMTGDSEYVYYSAWHSGSSGTRSTLAKTADNSNAAGPVHPETTSAPPFAGLAKMNGRLYGWTGRKLIEYDVASLTGNTPSALDGTNGNQFRKVFDSGVDPANLNVFGTQWWGGACASENQVFTFYTSGGQSDVYQYHNSKGGGPLWHCPEGFSIKQITYQNGILWCAGHWGGDSNTTGFGALYALPLDTLKPVFVNWFRRSQANGLNLQMQEMCGSYGNQIMVAGARTGRLFVYDADMDSVSMLDSIATAGSDGEGTAPFYNASPSAGTYGNGSPPTDGLSFTMNSDRVGDMVTFGKYRCVLIYDPSQSVGTNGNYRMLYYSDDEKWNRESSSTTNDYQAGLDSGDWDFRLPFERKALMGFDVSYEPLTTGQEIEVSYKTDQGSWVVAGTVTSASADASKGRTYIQVSGTDDASGEVDPPTGTVKFFSTRVKVILRGKRVSSTDHQPPVLLGLAAEAQLVTYDYVFELAIHLKNDTQGTRPNNREVVGWRLREWIWSIISDKSVVTFLDGYAYGPEIRNNAYRVTIENPQDVIKRNGEGTMRVTLRTIPN